MQALEIVSRVEPILFRYNSNEFSFAVAEFNLSFAFDHKFKHSTAADDIQIHKWTIFVGNVSDIIISMLLTALFLVNNLQIIYINLIENCAIESILRIDH